MPETLPAAIPLDELGRPVVTSAFKAKIDDAFKTVPEGKRGALVIISDEHGTRGHLAGRLPHGWKVAAGGGWNWNEKRPYGFVGVEFSW